MDVPASYLPSNAGVLTLGCRKVAARRSEVARECEDGGCACGGGWRVVEKREVESGRGCKGRSEGQEELGRP